MSKSHKIKVPVILGPTAVGKTDISLRLAREMDFEILSCDSRQIYKYMNIGTAKPSLKEMKKVRHWMIDIVDPSDYYSAYQFSQEALKIIGDGAKRNKTVLVCGGTGLYYQSLCEGLGPQIASNLTFRKKYKERALQEGCENIYKELEKCDPETASKLHPNDVQRVIRALQVYYDTGIPLSVHQEKKRPPENIEFFVLVITLPRPALYDRINKRVDAMFYSGLWEEFSLLYGKGYKKNDPGMQCVGYKELFDVMGKSKSLIEMIEKIKQNTRNYAKRQVTWFTNKLNGIHVDISGKDAYSEIKKMLVTFLKP
jgi:tRNA dimethylallyltransferase